MPDKLASGGWKKSGRSRTSAVVRKRMNNAKEIAEATGKAFIKELTSYLPLGKTAVSIYEEFQSKQIERKIKRLEEFYTDLAVTVNAEKDRINQEFVNRDDFLDVFEEATRYVVLERQEQKRILFKNILANSIVSPECDYDKTERYFRLLDNLGDIELRILAVLDNPEQYNASHGMIVKDPFQSAYQTTWETATSMGVLTTLLDLKVHEVEGAISILFSNGLIVEDSMGLRNLLTTRGKNFVKFLKE